MILTAAERPTLYNGKRGQSLVELAISLTVMLLLLSGAVSFGMAYYSYVSIRDAAQEGALYGSFNPCFDQNLDAKCEDTESPELSTVNLHGTDPANPDGICERVKEASTNPVDLADFPCNQVDPNDELPHSGNAIYVAPLGDLCEGTTSGSPHAIRVSIGYDYPIFMPFLGAILGSQTIHLTASVTDTILEPRCGT
jgi:hypothetical protein